MYSDHLVIVLLSLLEGLQRLLLVFEGRGRILGLRLPPDKSVVVSLCSRADVVAWSELAEVGSGAAEMALRAAARYLCVVVGPGPQEEQRGFVVATFYLGRAMSSIQGGVFPYPPADVP